MRHRKGATASHQFMRRLDHNFQMRTRDTVELLGVWERLNNPGSNPVEFDGIRIQAGLNGFTLTLKQWLEKVASTTASARRSWLADGVSAGGRRSSIGGVARE